MTGGGRGVFFEDDNEYIFALGVVKREKNCKLPSFYFYFTVTSRGKTRRILFVS